MIRENITTPDDRIPAMTGVEFVDLSGPLDVFAQADVQAARDADQGEAGRAW
jgi:putative intracellular protease/amidase